eukprot:12883-Heterococcus_DN1.PRE.1
MQNIVQDLELEFKRLGNDLQFANHNLDTLMATAAASFDFSLSCCLSCSGCSGKAIPDAHRLVRRIRSSQAALPALEQQQLQASQRCDAALKELSTLAVKNQSAMLQVYARIDCNPDEEWVSTANEIKAYNTINDENDAAAAATTASTNLICIDAAELTVHALALTWQVDNNGDDSSITAKPQ